MLDIIEQQQQQARVVASRTTLTKGRHVLQDGAASMRHFQNAGWSPLPGFQFRYIYFIDKEYRKRLTVPELPFAEIEKRGAGMYKGKPRERSADSGTSGIQPERGGAIPTRSLQDNPGEGVSG